MVPNKSITEAADKPVVFLFSMPFAAPASVKHMEKLIDCLTPLCHSLLVVGDGRIDMTNRPSHVVHHCSLPTLHPLRSVEPQLWSFVLWCFKFIWILLRATWALVETRQQVQLVICYRSVYYTPILLCARFLNKKTMIYLPNNEVEAAEIRYRTLISGQLLVHALRRLFFVNAKLAHICVIQSNRLMDSLHLNPYRQKVHVASLYVDTTIYTPSKPLEERSSLVGFIGRLSPEKGIIPLLEAMRIMSDSKISFRIIGDGQLRDEIESKLLDPCFSHVELVSWLDAKAVIKHMNDFRLLVLPTSNEGMPNVLLEAMACGTPVLATPVDGIPDLVHHNITGFLLPNQEPATIAQSVQEALQHPELGAIAHRGREHVLANYSLLTASNKWSDIFEELMGSYAI